MIPSPPSAVPAFKLKLRTEIHLGLSSPPKMYALSPATETACDDLVSSATGSFRMRVHLAMSLGPCDAIVRLWMRFGVYNSWFVKGSGRGVHIYIGNSSHGGAEYSSAPSGRAQPFLVMFLVPKAWLRPGKDVRNHPLSCRSGSRVQDVDHQNSAFNTTGES